MPWTTPLLTDVRTNNAAYIAGKLQVPILPNGEVRVLADANAGNAHLNLQYLDWQSDQYLPDTAEKEFLDRHGAIWLVNADGSRGRKAATFASGTATVTGIVAGTDLPQYSQLTSGLFTFETTADITLAVGANIVPIRALTEGSAGNLAAGTSLNLAAGLAGVNVTATVVALTGGTDEEDDDDLRARVLARIQKPPMGGDADDYVAWALAVPGVTRAWCSPGEMGLGTVTVRFMCDQLRATASPATNGFPLTADVTAVQNYINLLRPVTADVFVVAPIPQAVNFTITNLVGDSASLRAAVAVGVSAMLVKKAKPAYAFNGVAQPPVNIPAAWVNDAIYQAVNGVSFDLTMTDAAMANNGCMAVLGTIG